MSKGIVGSVTTSPFFGLFKCSMGKSVSKSTPDGRNLVFPFRQKKDVNYFFTHTIM